MQKLEESAVGSFGLSGAWIAIAKVFCEVVGSDRVLDAIARSAHDHTSGPGRYSRFTLSQFSLVFRLSRSDSAMLIPSCISEVLKLLTYKSF